MPDWKQAIDIIESFSGISSGEELVPGDGFLKHSPEDPENLLVTIDHIIETFIALAPNDIDTLVRHGTFMRFLLRLLHLPMVDESVQYATLYLVTAISHHCSFIVYPELAAVFARFLARGNSLLQSRVLSCIMELVDASDDFCDILLSQDDIISTCMDIITRSSATMASPLRVSALCVCVQILRRPTSRSFLLRRFPDAMTNLSRYATKLYAAGLLGGQYDVSGLLLEALALASEETALPASPTWLPVLSGLLDTEDPNDQLRALILVRSHSMSAPGMLSDPSAAPLLAVICSLASPFVPSDTSLLALSILASVASEGELPSALTSSDLLSNLLAIIRNPPTAVHAERASVMLQAVASTDGFMDSIDQVGDLFDHLKHFAESSSGETRRASLTILGQLAADPANVPALVDADLLSVVTKLLGGTPTIATVAIRILLSISKIDAYCPAIVDAGVLGKVASLLDTTQPALAAALVSLLLNLASVASLRHSIADTAPVLDFVSRILAADVPSADSDSAPQLTATSLLWHLSCDVSALSAIRAHPTILPDTMLMCLRAECRHPAYHAGLVSVLANMSSPEYMRESVLVRRPVLLAVTQLVDKIMWSSAPTYAKAMCKPVRTLLANMTSSHATAVVQTVGGRVPHVLSFLLNSGDPDTTLAALRMLHNITGPVQSDVLAAVAGAIVEYNQKAAFFVEMLDTFVEGCLPGTEEALLSVIRNLSKVVALRTQLCETPGLLNVITNAIHSAPSTNPAIFGLDALCKFAFVPACRTVLVPHTALLPVLGQALLSGELSAVLPAATTLWCLSLQPEARPVLVRADVITPTLIALDRLRAAENIPAVVRAAEGLLSTLWDLSMEPSSHRIFAQATIALPPALAWAMSLGTPKVIRAAVSLLSHLSSSRELHTALCTGPAFVPMVHMLVLVGHCISPAEGAGLTGFDLDPDVLDNIHQALEVLDPSMVTSILIPLSNTLANLSAREEAAQAMGTPPVIRELLAVLLASTNDTLIHTAAVTVHNVASSPHRLSIAMDPALVAAIIKRLGAPGVPDTTCGPLARSLPSISYQTETHERLATTEGFIDTCLGLMRVGGDSEHLHIAGATTLWNLSASASVHQIIVAHAGLLETVEQVLRTAASAAPQQSMSARDVLTAARAPMTAEDDGHAPPSVVASLSMLSNLSTSSQHRLAIVARPVLLESLVSMLHHPSKQVRALARQCTSRLFDSGSGGTLLPYLESLVRGMRG
ncbi:hypothetical protein J8273_3035 [Carpediemonas membranifera]|uniref:Uncharacterized protein n=1 Tax=Carpediemonas membranifera TaxID=201153 RepID=A0A8J6E346_9EUKA|nr:hypothetical protein J8273_3035 [Carpediemonas membranifera]|eukprot:KAG9395468.1 hypothetical protein J8273_3035 [Carpediemonas membranifera]